MDGAAEVTLCASQLQNLAAEIAASLKKPKLKGFTKKISRVR